MSAVLPLSIGAAARKAGCSVPTIRYYEEIGLLAPAARTDGNQRHYDEAALRRLAFIRRCRDFGFSLEQVRELVGLADHPDRDCVELRAIAQAQLLEVHRKLKELRELEASLAGFICSCDAACAGGPVADCTILEDLATPAPRSCCG